MSTPEDVKGQAVEVIRHRLATDPRLADVEITNDDVLETSCATGLLYYIMISSAAGDSYGFGNAAHRAAAAAGSFG